MPQLVCVEDLVDDRHYTPPAYFQYEVFTTVYSVSWFSTVRQALCVKFFAFQCLGRTKRYKILDLDDTGRIVNEPG